MSELEITPVEVRRRLAGGEPLLLVDVREPVERQLASIEPSEFIPMRSVPAELNRLEEHTENGMHLIVFCHHGVRSLQVAAWLREQGIESCQSMAGGIERWSTEVDPTVPRY